MTTKQWTVVKLVIRMGWAVEVASIRRNEGTWALFVPMRSFLTLVLGVIVFLFCVTFTNQTASLTALYDI